MSIKILTDSTSYIPNDIKDKYDISVVSLSVVFKDEAYKELEITNEVFYRKMKESNQIPTSSQPSIDEVYRIFENEIIKGNKVVALFISSEMSGTYSSANLVKNMILDKYPNAVIEIIDSRVNCMQLGFAAITAAKAAKEGKDIDEVISVAKDNLKRSRFLFTPDTLEYLKRGGRIGGASALLGTLLSIKPILTVSDGNANVYLKVRTKKKAVKTIIDIFMDDIGKHGFGNVIVHHIDCEEEANDIANTIKNQLGVSVRICPIGPVIGTHVGPNSIGIVYYTERDSI